MFLTPANGKLTSVYSDIKRTKYMGTNGSKELEGMYTDTGSIRLAYTDRHDMLKD